MAKVLFHLKTGPLLLSMYILNISMSLSYLGNIDTISAAAGKQRSGRNAAAMGWD
jgi:hypothetical protein